MADISNKTKLQLGSGFVKPPTSPATPTKLLINHGKPNFTIQRSPKADEENRKPFAHTNGNGIINDNKENNSNNTTNGEVVVKNTKFYGALNTMAAKESKVQSEDVEEEKGYANVVLRRTAAVPPVARKEGEENVPEFILRQRAIQQRLAKENVLDFENRRSGYFTQVHMSPTQSSPTSFVETMSSPAIVPGLEIPAPTPENSAEKQETIAEEKMEQNVEHVQPEQPKDEKKSEIIEQKIEQVEHKEELKIEQVESAVEHQEEQKIAQPKDEKSEIIEHKEEQKIAQPKAEESEIIEHKEEKVEHAVEHKIEQVESAVEHQEEQKIEQPKEEIVENGHVNDEDVNNVIEEINRAIAGEDVETKTVEEKTSETFEVPVKHNYHPLDYQNEVQVVHAHEEQVAKTDENNNEGDQITISHTNKWRNQ